MRLFVRVCGNDWGWHPCTIPPEATRGHIGLRGRRLDLGLDTHRHHLAMTAPLYHPRPERWPQFTLKGLLVVVAVVGLSLWWGVAMRAQSTEWNEERRAALWWIQDNSGEFSTSDGGDESWPPPLLIRAFGGRLGVRRIVLHPESLGSPSYDVDDLERLFPEAEVTIGSKACFGLFGRRQIANGVDPFEERF